MNWNFKLFFEFAFKSNGDIVDFLSLLPHEELNPNCAQTACVFWTSVRPAELMNSWTLSLWDEGNQKKFSICLWGEWQVERSSWNLFSQSDALWPSQVTETGRGSERPGTGVSNLLAEDEQLPGAAMEWNLKSPFHSKAALLFIFYLFLFFLTICLLNFLHN